MGTPEAATNIYDQDLGGRIAFVVGNEARGLSDAWRKGSFRGVKLPMSGIGDSLNVSVTASLMMFEAKCLKCATLNDNSTVLKHKGKGKNSYTAINSGMICNSVE